MALVLAYACSFGKQYPAEYHFPSPFLCEIKLNENNSFQ